MHVPLKMNLFRENLSKNHRVLFVEPPLTVFQPFRETQLNWRHLLNLGRFKYQGRNLYSYSPVRLFPLSFPGSKRFNYYEIDKQRTFNTLSKIVTKLEFKNPILWIFPDNAKALKTVHSKICVCFDTFVE